jgi:flagellar hook-associated protein 3 FlgL
VTYTGNAEAISSEISPDVLSEAQPVGANTSTTGPRGLLIDARSGADIFNHLISLRDHLLAGDKSAITTTDQANLKKDEEKFLYHYGHNGAIQSRLDAASSLAKDQSFAIEQQVSGLVDADLSQTLVKLNQVQNAYTAALQTGGSILSASLLDYLR